MSTLIIDELRATLDKDSRLARARKMADILRKVQMETPVLTGRLQSGWVPVIGNRRPRVPAESTTGYALTEYDEAVRVFLRAKMTTSISLQNGVPYAEHVFSSPENALAIAEAIS